MTEFVRLLSGPPLNTAERLTLSSIAQISATVRRV